MRFWLIVIIINFVSMQVVSLMTGCLLRILFKLFLLISGKEEKSLSIINNKQNLTFEKVTEIFVLCKKDPKFQIKAYDFFSGHGGFYRFWSFEASYHGGPLYFGISQTNINTFPQSGQVMGLFGFFG